MTTDLLPQNSEPSGTADPQQPPPAPSAAADTTRSAGGRRWLLAIGVICVLAVGAVWLPAAFSKPEQTSELTYTIARSDLIVSVTEQGTLESSNNTEVKCKVRGFSTVTWVIPAGSVVEAGDELVRLDTKIIEEQHSLTKTNTFIAKATLEESKANVAKSLIAIDAYKKGRYQEQMQGLEMELEKHKRNLRVAEEMLGRSRKLFRQGYVTKQEVEGNTFTVKQGQLELGAKKTEIRVLRDFTREMELETLEGNLTANNSKLAADEAGLAMELKRRDRAEQELKDCIIKAEKGGLVIYPSAAAWKRTPDITEGATVRKDQVLLLMPDLSKMQVKVGIHESMIERVKPGLKALVTPSDRSLTVEAEVSSVASVTRPAGWWTGNVVKYDTIIELPPESGLKPGMSAEVEVVLAVHKDVLTIPVAAVLETSKGDYCWVKTEEGAEKRLLQLGDSNDVFIIIKGGLNEGDEVVLNPTAYVEEARTEALNTQEETEAQQENQAGEASEADDSSSSSQ